MTDARRDFLLRFAATALAAAASGCDSPSDAPMPVVDVPPQHGPMVVYGPPPNWEGSREEFHQMAGHAVFFGDGRLDLDAEAKAALDRQIRWLRQYTHYLIVLEGNCDERGTPEYNLALGERRARAVKIYMVMHGLAADRIQVVSYGKERPADPGHTKEAWARNRRVDTVLHRE